MTETRITIPEVENEITAPTGDELLVARDPADGEDKRLKSSTLATYVGGAIEPTLQSYVDNAESAALIAESARDASLLSKGLWPTTAAGIGQGVAGSTITSGGSGGTDGTFALAFSGGTQVLAPAGVFTVVGGAVVSVTLTYSGYYSAGTPTFDFSASAGLTGTDITAVMAANTDVNEYFSVPVESSDDSLILYRVDSGPTAFEVTRYPSSNILTRLKKVEEYGTAWSRYIEGLRGPRNDKPHAAVVILLGQSLNQARAADTNLIGKLNTKAKMFAGGASVATFDFWDFSTDAAAKYADFGTVTDYAETVGQTPGVGISATLVGGKFQRAYICSVAVGARSVLQLASGGPACNLYAAAHQFCDIARADGYEPVVMFYSAHGEQDSAIGTTEANYYTYAMSYYGVAQLVAAQAMRKPDYVAPVALTYPLKMFDTDDDRAIKEAIRRVAADLPNAIDCGGIYQWPSSVDRVHPASASNIQRGEYVGKALRDFYERGNKWASMQIVDVTWDGSTTFVVTFSEPVQRDDTLGVGTNLNAANAEDGFEWLDNGSFVPITGLVYSGYKVTGTLGSAPVGTVEQQELRYAVQDVDTSSTAADADRPGGFARAVGNGFPSIYQSSYTHQTWAAPQKTTVRSA